jgi:hypothetical protein
VHVETRSAPLPGTKSGTYVYLADEAIAEQYVVSTVGAMGQETVKWRRTDPPKTNVHLHDEWSLPAYMGDKVQMALDLQGISTEVPDYTRLQQNPGYYNQTYNSYNYGGYGGYGAGYDGGGMPGNFGTGCLVDGLPMDCETAMHMNHSGGADINAATSTGIGNLSGAIPVYGTFCVDVSAGTAGYTEQECETEIVGYTSIGQIATDLPMRELFKPLNPSTLNELRDNHQYFLNDPDCANFLQEMVAALPETRWRTERDEGSFLDAFDRVDNNGGFWSGDIFVTDGKGNRTSTLLGEGNPNTLTVVFNYQLIAPLITSSSSRDRFGSTIVLIHELTHLYTKKPSDGVYGHIHMAEAARDAAKKVGVDVSKIEFPTTDKYGVDDAYQRALSEYFGRVVSAGCSKVKFD